MAYDGIVTAATVRELNEALSMGSISKVAQPEKDELLLTLKVNRKQLRLCISANASTPMIYLKEENAVSPATAPNFCMTLRKHIGGGRILKVLQPAAKLHLPDAAKGALSDPDFGGRDPFSHGLERIVVFVIEHLDEMGDLSIRYLICELMGKHSNIILTRQDLTIIDSIKHISHMTSSVREVLPGRSYFIPDANAKSNPLELMEDAAGFERAVFGNAKSPGPDEADVSHAEGPEKGAAPSAAGPIGKRLYQALTGLSPVVAGEICFLARVDPDLPAAELSREQRAAVFAAFSARMTDVAAGHFTPNIIYDNDKITEFSAIRLTSLEGGSFHREEYDSIFEVIRLYFEKKDKQNRIRAKSEDIRHILKLLTERTAKKLDLLEKQYKDTEKREQYRVFGELINTYGYALSGGEDHLICANYYDEGREIRIPLDPLISARDNAIRYFDRYQKLKRTREAAAVQIEEARQTLWHLDSIAQSLTLCETEADLNELRREMADAGFVHKNADRGKNGPAGGRGSRRQISFGTARGSQKNEKKSKPLHFVSSDGIDLYVGRNNYQNEELDFKLADNNDWWFHAKNMPGSHVIAKTGSRELPDATCLEAAALAAYYSKAGMGMGDGGVVRGKAGNTEKIEVDYVQKRELKRVPGAAPGYVIYHTNYSIVVEPRAEV